MKFKRRPDSPLKKKARRGFRGYPVATVAYYGPDDQRASKVAVGIATGFAMQAIGLDRTTVWALAAAVLHTIPYLGAALLAGAAGLVAYLQLGTVNAALLAMALVLAITGALGIGLQTWLTGRAARMNPPAVFVSLLFWGMLWGAWGLLLGVPIMVAFKTACDHTSPLRWVGVLLGPDGTNYRTTSAP